jgi:PAS domain S-box-containing protein
MLDWLAPFFDVQTLSPHGICLLWRPELIWTHAVSDVLIGVAYFSIPLALSVFLYNRRDVQFGWAVWLFVLFIMLCGVTHFMMVWTLWNPDYGVEALIKAATATASVVTAFALWPLLPKAIAIPSTHTLQARIDERDAALAELQQIMATMVRMEEHQREQTRLLEDVNRSEARLRSVFENAAVGIARVGIDGRFLELNERFAEIAGWSREDLLAGDFQQITHPDDLDEDLAQVGAVLAGEISSYAMEKRYVRRDGGTVWIHLTGSLVRTADGQPDHFVSIIDDITDEKRTKENRDLLLREVDHRARNVLMVVQSVVRLTEVSEPQAFKAVVTGRIDALARAQASLARANWTGSSLMDVASQELSSPANTEQVELHGPEVHVESGQVQPLSMILHELATNAAKYGGLSTRAGRVSVSWERLGPGWRLIWAERGGPPVTPPDRTGFGSRLIERLARELGGQARMDWRSTGLVVELTVTPEAVNPDQAHPFIGALARLHTDGVKGEGA